MRSTNDLLLEFVKQNKDYELVNDDEAITEVIGYAIKGDEVMVQYIKEGQYEWKNTDKKYTNTITQRLPLIEYLTFIFNSKNQPVTVRNL